MLGRGDDARALEVPAPLRPLLILQDDPRHVRLHALADGANDVQRVAVARVHVRHERHVDGRDDGAHAVEHLGGGEEPVVGRADGTANDAPSGPAATLGVLDRRRVGPCRRRATQSAGGSLAGVGD